MCGGLLPGAWRGPLAVSPAVLVSAAVTEGQAGSARPVTTPAAALVLSFRLHTEPLRLHVLSVAFTEREFAWRPGPSGCQHAHWPVLLQSRRVAPSPRGPAAPSALRPGSPSGPLPACLLPFTVCVSGSVGVAAGQCPSGWVHGCLPVTCRWTLWFFPHFGSCEQSCCGHSWARVCEDACFPCSGQ